MFYSYTQEELIQYTRHLDRRLKDTREYSEELLLDLIQSSIQRMCIQSSPFEMIEKYLGEDIFIPTGNIQAYDIIAYEDYMDDDEPLAPSYRINNDKTVTVDKSTFVEGVGDLIFKYWYIPNIIDNEEKISFGDRIMNLFNQYLKITLYKYMRDTEQLKYAIDELNFLLATSIDTDMTEIRKSATARGMM